MTEAEAREWITSHFGVSRETQLQHLVRLLTKEATAQNLVAPSTIDQIWTRHIVDSAQLSLLAEREGRWIDVGSGAGLPGLVLAILSDQPIELVEPRRLRTAFLERAAHDLGLTNVTVVTAKVERTDGVAGVITARAVASLEQLFAIASHRADPSTVWVLPKGRSAYSEVEAAQHKWHGSFHVEPSITAADSLIVVARGVRRK
jgi:16S rRNA (guanine527-N7)-methyltransferase